MTETIKKHVRRLAGIDLDEIIIRTLYKDAITMSLRLISEDPANMSPECAEVVDRYKPICIKLLNGESSYENAMDFWSEHENV